MGVIPQLATAKKNLESYRLKMERSEFFECGCCGLTWRKKHLKGVYNYESPASLSSRMVGPAAYALCEKCGQDLSPKHIFRKVTQMLAKNGLFG